MGYSIPERRVPSEAEQDAIESAEYYKTAARERLAHKIIMAVTDRIVADIIRPGPKPEERECYEMASELRAIAPALTELAAAVLKVADEEGA